MAKKRFLFSFNKFEDSICGGRWRILGGNFLLRILCFGNDARLCRAREYPRTLHAAAVNIEFNQKYEHIEDAKQSDGNSRWM